jgi:hypothetical protein
LIPDIQVGRIHLHVGKQCKRFMKSRWHPGSDAAVTPAAAVAAAYCTLYIAAAVAAA